MCGAGPVHQAHPDIAIGKERKLRTAAHSVTDEGPPGARDSATGSRLPPTRPLDRPEEIPTLCCDEFR